MLRRYNASPHLYLWGHRLGSPCERRVDMHRGGILRQGQRRPCYTYNLRLERLSYDLTWDYFIKDSPIYIDELSFFTWSSTYVVPSVNNGLPPHPNNSCAITNNKTGPNVDDLLCKQLSPRSLLCGASGGLDNPLCPSKWLSPRSGSCTDTSLQILSDVKFEMEMAGFASPVKWGTLKMRLPIPIMTAPMPIQTGIWRREPR